MSTDLRHLSVHDISVPERLTHLPDALKSASLPSVHKPDLKKADLKLPDVKIPKRKQKQAEALLDKVTPAAHDFATASGRQIRKASKQARKAARNSTAAREAAAIASALAEESAWRAHAMRSAAAGNRSHRVPVAFGALALGFAAGGVLVRRFAPATVKPTSPPPVTPSPPYPNNTSSTTNGADVTEYRIRA